jgi:hypothetical protein
MLTFQLAAYFFAALVFSSAPSVTSIAEMNSNQCTITPTSTPSSADLAFHTPPVPPPRPSSACVSKAFASPPPPHTATAPPIHKLLDFIRKINHANHIVNDMCETLEEKVGLWSGSDKPNCQYNASYIVNSSIVVFHVGANVRSFFLARKQTSCKEAKLECGELSIIIKLVDLVNSLVHISSKVSSTNELFLNLEATSFDELFQTYVESLDNTEILANITLRKDRANSILERERQRIRRQSSRSRSEDFFESIQDYIGTPIKSLFTFAGRTVGEAVGSTLEGATESIGISRENKLFAFAIILLIWKR